MSLFGDGYKDAFQVLLDFHGDTVSYVAISDGSTTSIQAIFNELVGALDEFKNAVFSVSTLSSNGIENPERGDLITLNGTQWEVVDVRDAEDNSAELRCIAPDITS